MAGREGMWVPQPVTQLRKYLGGKHSFIPVLSVY